jgi:hypothetical protein
VTIYAVFESTEAAEWALMRLRARAVRPVKYSIRALDKHLNKPDNYIPAHGMENAIPALVGLSMLQNHDFCAQPVAAAWAASGSDERDTPRDGFSREVLLTLETPEKNARTAKSVLISNRATNVQCAIDN